MVESTTKNRYMMSSIFDSTGRFQLDENLADGTEKDSRVDGENIIGSVQGVFFVPDGFSRNNRFYPCELWNKQLSDDDINRRLSNSIMFGCIGHSQGPVTEQDLSDGKVSHIMDKLWIDENTGMGMGKAYILNTPAGRNLRTYLKAGSNLKVSSRGEGSFAEGVEKDGHPVVEAASYNLITFDFVIEPGFTETNPQLQESYIEEVLIDKETIVESTGKEESMDEKLLEDLKAEKESAVKSLEECQAKHSKEVSMLRNRIKSLTEKLSECSKADRKLSATKVRVGKLNKLVESYEKLGTVEDIRKASKISKAAIQELRSYKTLGTISEMQLVLDKLVKVSKELNEYRAFGSVESLKNLMAMSERFVKLQSHQAVVNEAKDLSEKSGKPIEEVAEMIKKEGVKSTKKTLVEKEEAKKVDVILETKPSEKVVEKKETKEEKATSLLESLFAESSARMFITEEDDEMEDEEEKKKPIEDEEVEDDENSDEDKEEKEVEDEETDGDEAEEDETPEGQEPETEEERIDSLEDEVDNLQSQIDALTATFDRMQDENGEYKEEDDFDFEIE